MKHSFCSLVAALALAGTPVAQAANLIYLTPSTQDAYVGLGSVTLELFMDFDDQTVGGGIDLAFSGPIAYGAFTPSDWFTGSALDPAFSGFGTELADNDVEIHLGNFAGFGGLHKLGDLQVDLSGGIGPGEIILSLNSTFGAFFPTDGFEPLEVGLGGATINAVAAVPLPAGAWLLLTGLGGLALRRRRRA